MDLYLCLGCNRRFVTSTGEPTAARRCRVCGHPLELKVRSIPGRRDRIEAALNAESLDEPPIIAGPPPPSVPPPS